MGAAGVRRPHRISRGVEFVVIRGLVRRFHWLVTTTFLAYAFGADAAAITSNKWLILAVSVVSIAALMLVANLGLRIGKWVTNAGSSIYSFDDHYAGGSANSVRFARLSS